MSESLSSEMALQNTHKWAERETLVLTFAQIRIELALTTKWKNQNGS